MIDFKMSNIDERKRQIIDTLNSAPNVDESVPVQDRVIIADLIISGVEKVMATVDAHLDMSAPVLKTADGVGALTLMLVMEIGHVSNSLAHQIGMSALQAVADTPGGLDDLLRDMGACRQ